MSGPTEPPSGVHWSAITGKGRGVVATRDCAAGEEVERAPVIPVARAALAAQSRDHPVFEEYLLHWSDEAGAELAMGCGLLMLYNHSSRPNIEFRSGPEPLTMSVVTLRDVHAGDELLYDYGVELWFTET